MSSTGERIKDARKKKGLTMDKLAHLMGVKSQRTIVNWENGTTEPKRKIIKKLSEVLEVDEAYLLGTQKEPKIISLKELSDLLNPRSNTPKAQYHRLIEAQQKSFTDEDYLGNVYLNMLFNKGILTDNDKNEIIDYLVFKNGLTKDQWSYDTIDFIINNKKNNK